MEHLSTEDPTIISETSEIASDPNATSNLSSSIMNIAEEAHANPVPGEVRINLHRSHSFSDTRRARSPHTARVQVLSTPVSIFQKVVIHFKWCVLANMFVLTLLTQLLVLFFWRYGGIRNITMIWLEPTLLLIFIWIGYRWRLARRRARENLETHERPPIIRRSSQRRHGIRPRTSDLMRALIIQQIQINQARMILNSLNQDNIESEGMPFRARIMFAPRGQISSYLEDFVNNIEAFNPPNPGLSTEQIESEMPKFNYSSSNSQSCEAETCTICLEDFQEGVEIRRAPCKHLFHKDCIDGWLSLKKMCPNCKSEIHTANPLSTQQNLFDQSNQMHSQTDVESGGSDLV